MTALAGFARRQGLQQEHRARRKPESVNVNQIQADADWAVKMRKLDIVAEFLAGFTNPDSVLGGDSK